MINNLKDLDALFKLCRKRGIPEMEISGIKFKVGDLPKERTGGSDDTEADSDNPYGEFPDRVLTNEELMFYSSGGAQGTAPPEVEKQ